MKRFLAILTLVGLLTTSTLVSGGLVVYAAQAQSARFQLKYSTLDNSGAASLASGNFQLHSTLPPFAHTGSSGSFRLLPVIANLSLEPAEEVTPTTDVVVASGGGGGGTNEIPYRISQDGRVAFLWGETGTFVVRGEEPGGFFVAEPRDDAVVQRQAPMPTNPEVVELIAPPEALPSTVPRLPSPPLVTQQPDPDLTTSLFPGQKPQPAPFIADDDLTYSFHTAAPPDPTPVELTIATPPTPVTQLSVPSIVQPQPPAEAEQVAAQSATLDELVQTLQAVEPTLDQVADPEAREQFTAEHLNLLLRARYLRQSLDDQNLHTLDSDIDHVQTRLTDLVHEVSRAQPLWHQLWQRARWPFRFLHWYWVLPW